MLDFKNIWQKCLGYNIEQKPEEFEQLITLLDSQKRKKYALEIGSNFGGTSVALCHLYEKVIAIDIKYHENFDRIKSEFDNFDYIIMDSKSNNLLKILKNMNIEFDFIFIDGDHSYEGVKSDYERFKQFCNTDGLIGFHDIIDSDLNKQMGNDVDILWRELDLGEKYEFISKERRGNFEETSLFHKLNINVKYSDFGGIGVIKNTPISVFSHNYLDNHWIETVTSQITRLINSGLYKSSHKIFFGVQSKSSRDINLFQSIVEKFDVDSKINIMIFEENTYEFSTLIFLQNYCKINKNGISLYYHTKGTSRKKNTNIESWRECLEYFNIDKWKSNFLKINLENFDVSGALYITWFHFLDIKLENYYSGNFWWAKNSYISNLPNIDKLFHKEPENRTLCELWIGMSPHLWFNHYSDNVTMWYEHYFDPKIYKNNT